MAAPVVDDHTALSERFIDAPVLAIVAGYEPGFILDAAATPSAPPPPRCCSWR